MLRTLSINLKSNLSTEKRVFLTGNQAVAMGKVLGGCRVQTYYPITPAADESEYIEAHEILKTRGTQEAVIVLQTEDEIAAINSASGACLAGARAATSTSGPGFSLMVEGFGWAGNNEVPSRSHLLPTWRTRNWATHTAQPARPAVCDACRTRRIRPHNTRIR